MEKMTNFNLEKATAKILMLKEQTAQNIIEIGKTLIEVKENIGHGNFGNYLKNKVEFSHYTANRFMKIATEFSNSTTMCNLNSTKLFLLAGLDEEDRQEVIQENNVEDMTTRELEQVVKEKKEIKKQLEAEQEYSQELQEAIKEKNKQIQELKQIKNEPQIIEKEIIKEVEKKVIPDNIQQQIKQLEEQKQVLENKLEKAEGALKSVKLENNLEKDNMYYKTNLDLLLADIKRFLDSASKYTYLKEELQKIPSRKKKFIENGVNRVKDWTVLMEQALDNRQDVVGNIIYGEGEVVDE